MQNWVKNKLQYNNNYNKKTYKQFILRLNIKTEKNIIDIIEKQENKNEFLKKAILNYCEK